MLQPHSNDKIEIIKVSQTTVQFIIKTMCGLPLNFRDAAKRTLSKWMHRLRPTCRVHPSSMPHFLLGERRKRGINSFRRHICRQGANTSRKFPRSFEQKELPSLVYKRL